MAAPAAVPPIWTTGCTDSLKTGTWRNEVAVHQKSPAPCHNACPVEGEIPVWIQELRNGDPHAAFLTLAEHNPIPAAIGRTCHRPCENKCNRTQYDGSVAINALEQYVGDLAIKEGWALPGPKTELKPAVAIVGGGPAGLSCAYQLRRKGYQVTIYDANPELGGVLRYGVPEFRLPARIVAAEAARVVALGVKVVPNRRLRADDLDRLLSEYSAVFLALGAHKPKRLPQFPTDNSQVIDAIDFLRGAKLGQPAKLGKKVVVIGGGSVAMDAAASAIRLGSSATIVAVESRAVMPAEAEEVQDVMEEGGALLDAAMVKRVESGSAGFKLLCAKCNLDQTASGAIVPREVKGTDFDLHADTIILAVGQDPDLEDWQARLTTARGMLTTNHSYMTSLSGVFAAGDVANSVRFVSTAIGDGERAARAIAHYLGEAEPRPSTPPEAVGFDKLNMFYFPNAERVERAKLEADRRKASFGEMRQVYAEAQANEQAERCFSCGECTQCDNCFYFCPDMAILRDADTPLHYRVLDDYCKGCGSCVTECPRGAMVLVEETK